MERTGFTVTGRAWRDGVCVASDVAEEGLKELIEDPSVLAWVDLVDPREADLIRVGQALGLSPGAVEDALAPLERPKLTRHRAHLFFVIYATRMVGHVHEDPDDLTRIRLSRISAFVLPTALVTVRLPDRRGSRFNAADLVNRWEESPDLLRSGTSGLVHGLVDVVVDGHFDTIQELDDELEALEDVLFEDQHTGTRFIRRVYALRKDLVRLRRVVLPMREVVNSLLRNRRRDEPTLDPYYEDLYDHVLRASEWTESLRDLVTSIFETNLSLQDAKLNAVMKKLAGWAAIIAVPTAITGWFGQNVPYPGFSSHAGLVQSTALILISTVSLYLLFRRQDWL